MKVETRTKRGMWLYLLGSLGLLVLAVALSVGAAQAGAPNQALPAQDNGKADMPQAQPQLKPQVRGSGPVISANIPAPAAPYVTLYDQYNSAGANASNSQDFETAQNTFDDQVADDFPVPSGQNWQITEVDLQGQYFNGPGPAASFNVFFYTNGGALPATPVYTATNLAYTNTTGNFVIPLTTPANLTGGATYWVSVQARQDFSPAGQFGWQNRTVTFNSPAAFRNPGGGFACPGGNGWVARTNCVAGTEPDQVFRLVGSITTCGTDYITNTSTGNAIVPGVTDIGNHCDDCTTAVTFPFPITIYATAYTTGTVSSNGNLQLVGAVPNLGAGCLPNAAFNKTIFPYQDDLKTTGTSDGVFTTVTGAAPNRTFYMEWRTTYFSRAGTANFELVFPEGSTAFSIIYGATADNGAQETSGVQSSSTGPATQYSCLQATLTSGLRINYTLPSCVTATATTTATPTSAASPTCSPNGGPGPWTAALPYPKTIGRYGFAQVGNSFYVIGGVSASVRVTDTNRYDVATNTWTALAPIPVASEAPTCAYLSSNNKIYCAEGETGNSFRIYDIASNTWTTGPPVPGTTNRYGAVSGAFNGKVYVAGGSSAISADAQVYTVATNSWAAASPIPSGVLLSGYQPVGQYLYVVGGFTSTPLANNNSAAGAASSLLDRANGTGGGGAGRPQVPDANIAATYRLDMNTGIWSTGPVFTPQRADLGLAYDSVAGKIFAIGGDATGGGYFDPTALVDELDVSTWPAGMWTASSPVLPSVRQANQAGFYSTGRIWSTGGVSPFVFTNEHLFRTTTGNGACATSTATVTSTATATNTSISTPTATATACTIRFADVPATGDGSTFYSFIQCLACRHVVSGYNCGGTNPQTGQSEPCNGPNNTGDPYYRPANNVTRGQLSKIIALAAGLTYVVPANQQSFHDVILGDPFYLYIEQLSQTGAISGYACGPTVIDPQHGQPLPCDGANRPWFVPNNLATRGQISKIVAIAANFNENIPATQQTFTDVPQNSPFWVYIERLASRGIISGYSDAGRCGTATPCFRYGDQTTRGQMAKIAANGFPGCPLPPPAPAKP